MRGVIAGAEREDLLREIHNAFLQWPELERRIFSQAHYYGQSPEAISRSVQLDVEEVSTILKQCQRRLYASLRSFRKSNGEETLLLRDGIARLDAHEQGLGIPALAPG
jgi:DNA-directed RNA polymerase specialized sigma24 family protein